MNARKLLALVFGVAMGVVAAGGAWAQAFPSKPVTLIVPWPPGGSTDIAMRALASATEKHLGQAIVIDNKPGASGTLGPATMAASAKPDGYTVAQMPITVFRLPYMQKTAFDPAKDFTYVIHVTGYTFGVVVKADSPHKTFKDLLAFAKDNPGKVTYATPGAGTSLHITMEQIALKAGVKWTQVPFKGGAETNAAVLGGHVTATADSTGWGPLVNAGELRLLVTWGAQRTKNWPTVPTLKEIGIDMVSNSPFGIAGPKGMDPKAVQVLHDAFRKGMQETSYLAAIAKIDMENDYKSTADYAKYAMDKIAEEKDIIARLGLAQK
ncbi:MAG: tripartite tricarboxylate transporter substrate binding protein [Alphaproteobacteria bacterium]|nr:tripartite tricarboxylate transporter substrate binding protein [Alphaproteobacteria bacterium]